MLFIYFFTDYAKKNTRKISAKIFQNVLKTKDLFHLFRLYLFPYHCMYTNIKFM